MDFQVKARYELKDDNLLNNNLSYLCLDCPDEIFFSYHIAHYLCTRIYHSSQFFISTYLYMFLSFPVFSYTMKQLTPPALKFPVKIYFCVVKLTKRDKNSYCLRCIGTIIIVSLCSPKVSSTITRCKDFRVFFVSSYPV